MLAIQRPTMGSTQPSDPNLPFGYAVDPTQESFFLDQPPEPAPGAPLLTANDTKLLENFFENMTSDHFATTSFGEGLNFSEDWLNLPPQFMGTATSFGQQPALPIESPPHAIHNANFQTIMHPQSTLMPPPPPPVAHIPLEHQHPSADVLEAASLLQHGSLARSNSTSHDSIFSSRDMAASVPSVSSHLRHQSLGSIRQDERRAAHSTVPNDHDHTFTEMMFGSVSQTQTRSIQTPADLRWGSDDSFTKAQGFVPSSEKETREAMEEEQLRYMGCLEVSKSAASTRPSSPLHHHADVLPLKLKTRVPMEPIKMEDGHDMPARKRRKSRAKEEVDDDEEEPLYATLKNAVRKRKSKAEAPSVTPPATTDASGKRRKSAINGASKQPRENLSEDQKRENHIKSEQKRRTLIKEGFDDLCDLVPGLRGGGFSKSTMLAMAAEWLEELLKGNDQLKAQLAQLEGR